MEKALSYQDVYAVPQYSDINSRSEVSTETDFLGRKWALPIIPANMSSVIDEKLAKQLSDNNVFYIMHRFGDNRTFVRKANVEGWKNVSISVGVQKSDYEFIEWWSHETSYVIDFITIDIAHGHSLHVKNMIKHILAHFDGRRAPKIIAGNVATIDGVRDLYSWGADAVKVGIAGGGVCSTKTQTGFHVPMFSCINNSVYGDIPVIADGGIRDNGDIAKALIAGATMVMAGSIFAACEDAPGEDVYLGLGGVDDAKLLKPAYKKYFGSASAKQKGQNKYVEGFETLLPCNGLTFEQKLLEIKESLQSAGSYAGVRSTQMLFGTPVISIK